MRNLHTVFCNGYTKLYSHQQCTRISSTPHHGQHLTYLSDNSHFKGVKWHLIKNLICIALMINDAENIFTYLLTICTLSLEKCLFRFSANFLIWLFRPFWLCVLFFFVWVYFAIEFYIWSYWAQVIAGKAMFSLKAQEKNLFNCYSLLWQVSCILWLSVHF